MSKNLQRKDARSFHTQHNETDKAGVQDFVLLEDFKSENAFIQNLKVRFNSNLIYVRSPRAQPTVI